MDSPIRLRGMFFPAIVCGLLAITGIGLANSAVRGLGIHTELPNGGRGLSFPQDGRSDQELDTGNWKRIKNESGWVMKIPAGWKDQTGDGTFETSDLAYIGGPENCSTQTAACALVSVERFPPDAGISKKSLEAYLGIDTPDSKSTEFLNARKIKLAGEFALDVCIKEKASGTIRSREVVLKHSGALFNISYHEVGKHDQPSPDIKSPKDWRYVSFFEKMLTTFSFYK